MPNEATSTSLYVPKKGERVRIVEICPKYINNHEIRVGDELVVSHDSGELSTDARFRALHFCGEHLGKGGAYVRVEPAAPKREDLCDACGAPSANSMRLDDSESRRHPYLDGRYFCCKKHGSICFATAEPEISARRAALQSSGREFQIGDEATGKNILTWRNGDADDAPLMKGKITRLNCEIGGYTDGVEIEGIICAPESVRLIRPAQAASEELRFYGTMPSVLPETLPAGTRFRPTRNAEFRCKFTEVVARSGVCYVGQYAGSNDKAYGSGLADPDDIDWSTVPIAHIPTGDGKRDDDRGLGQTAKIDPYREHMIALERLDRESPSLRIWMNDQDKRHADRLAKSAQAKEQLDAPIRTQHDGHGYRRTVSHATFAPPAWPEDSEHEWMV